MRLRGSLMSCAHMVSGGYSGMPLSLISTCTGAGLYQGSAFFGLELYKQQVFQRSLLSHGACGYGSCCRSAPGSPACSLCLLPVTSTILSAAQESPWRGGRHQLLVERVLQSR